MVGALAAVKRCLAPSSSTDSWTCDQVTCLYARAACDIFKEGPINEVRKPLFDPYSRSLSTFARLFLAEVVANTLARLFLALKRSFCIGLDQCHVLSRIYNIWGCTPLLCQFYHSWNSDICSVGCGYDPFCLCRSPGCWIIPTLRIDVSILLLSRCRGRSARCVQSLRCSAG